MKTKLKILMAGAISIMLSASFSPGTSQAAVAVIDFNGMDNTSGLLLQNPYSEDGYTLTNSGISTEPLWAAGLFWGRDNINNADPDGATFSHNFRDTTTILTKDGGGAFDFNTIDLAEAGALYNYAIGGDIEFVFTRGSTETTQTVPLDGVWGLETFTFNESGVDSVKWTPLTTDGPWLQLDDITVYSHQLDSNTDHPRQEVPEPSTLLLLGTGFVTLALGGRKLINSTD